MQEKSSRGPHAAIVERFGTAANLGDLIGEAHDTVRHWKRKGWIPARHHQKVLKAGQRLDPPLRPEDFFS